MIRSFSLCIAIALTQLVSAQDTWSLLDTSNTDLPRNVVSFLAFGGNGDLWTATEWTGDQGLGLFRFDGSTWTHFDALDCPAFTDGVRCAASDAAGNMWFGTYMKGLVKFDGTTWTVYNTGNSGIPNDNVTTIALDGANNVWVATWTGGLSRFDGSTWTTWTSSNTPLDENFQCTNAVEFYNGKVWVGLGCEGGLVCYDPAIQSWSTITDVPQNNVRALKNDGQGNLWVSYSYSNNMTSRFNGSTWTNDYFPGTFDQGPYNDLAVGLDGQVWRSALGLWHFEDNQWALSGTPVPDDGEGTLSQSIAVGLDGSIWWAEYNGIWTNHDPSIHDLNTEAVGEQAAASNGVIIYPNPASQRVTISLPTGLSSGTVRLFDAQGTLVRELSVRDGAQMEIDRDGLSAGVYSVIVMSDKGTQTKDRVVFE